MMTQMMTQMMTWWQSEGPQRQVRRLSVLAGGLAGAGREGGWGGILEEEEREVQEVQEAEDR